MIENTEKLLSRLGEQLELIGSPKISFQNPSPEEIEGAARWCMKQDPSEGFRQILVNMLQELGFEDVSRKL